MTVLVSETSMGDKYRIADDIRTIAKRYGCKILQLQNKDANVYDTIQTVNDTPRMAVFILQTNYPSRRIMRRIFNVTSIKMGRIMGRTRRLRKVDMSLSWGEI